MTAKTVLPLAERVELVADAFELDEVLATERQLLYVAATVPVTGW